MQAALGLTRSVRSTEFRRLGRKNVECTLGSHVARDSPRKRGDGSGLGL